MDATPDGNNSERGKSRTDTHKISRRHFLMESSAFTATMLGVPGMTGAADTRGNGKDGTAWDCIIVGSGINSLVAAGMLAKAGRRVCVLERNAQAGGCIRTEQLTLPGFHHDVLSGFYPLFVTSPAYAALGDDLRRHGVEFANTRRPTAVVMPDGRSLVLSRDHNNNVDLMNKCESGDGDAYRDGITELLANADLTFGLLGKELWTYDAFRLMFGAFWKMGAHGLMAYFGNAVKSCRSWLESCITSDLVRALVAPWVLHTGLGPDHAMSGFMAKLIFLTLEQAGMPIVKGGSRKLVDAFQKLIEENNGTVLCGIDVEKILMRDGRAVGVQSHDGRQFNAKEAVICNVTPGQLYGKLLESEPIPEAIKTQANRYRYGRGDMQIHLALKAPLNWPNPALKEVAMVHLTPGLNGVSQAVSQADCGLLPEQATIVVGQPSALDPSRAPGSSAALWIQLQELPPDGGIRGDAAGQLRVPENGKWTPALAEQYADRIIARIARHVPDFPQTILKRRVLSPADLAACNINLVGGDPYAGACAMDQFLLWRPLRGTKNHSTPIKDLYHIGAATHPGPGLGGVSGYLAAKRIIG